MPELWVNLSGFKYAPWCAFHIGNALPFSDNWMPAQILTAVRISKNANSADLPRCENQTGQICLVTLPPLGETSKTAHLCVFGDISATPRFGEMDAREDAPNLGRGKCPVDYVYTNGGNIESVKRCIQIWMYQYRSPKRASKANTCPPVRFTPLVGTSHNVAQNDN